MTTTDSVDKRGHLYPNGSRRFVHAAIVAGFMATFMFSDNVFGDEPQSNPIADVYYDAGVKARIDKDLARALELFRKAWALEHSALIAAKLAQTERDLGHYRDAIEHFEFFMQQAGQSEEDRAAIAQLLAEAKSKIVVLEIRVDTAGAEILVDLSVVGVAPLPLPQEIRIDPGKRIVEVRNAGCTFEKVSTEFAPGSKEKLFFACNRPKPSEPVHIEKTPTWKYVMVPLSVAVAGIGFGGSIWQRSRANDLSAAADVQLSGLSAAASDSGYTCSPKNPNKDIDGCGKLRSTLADKDFAYNLGTVGLVMGSVGFVGAVVAIAWPKSSDIKKLSVTPVFRGSATGIVIGGSF